MIAAHFRACEDDDDLAVLRQCMRPEEDLRQYRQRTPWKGLKRGFIAEKIRRQVLSPAVENVRRMGLVAFCCGGDRSFGAVPFGGYALAECPNKAYLWASRHTKGP